MEPNQLVEKFVNGEITEEQFDEHTKEMTPEAIESLKAEATKKLPDVIEKLKGARRGVDKVIEKNQTQESTIATKMREENYDSAKSAIFAQLGIEKEEDKIAFEEGFKKFDTGSVNAENIVKDMKAYYASTKSDEFFQLKEKQKLAEQEAEEYNAQFAGSEGSGGGEDPTKKVSKEVKAYMEASRKQGRVVTAEFAERALRLAANKGRIG